MKKYRRICVIGNSGSGKSTLATQLGEIFQLPVYHLDKIYWRENWEAVPKEQTQKEVRRIAVLEDWIIDGNNKSTLPERLARADLVIYLDFKPLFCLYRVIKRSLTTVSRPDMAEGCRERFNLPFYKYVLSFNRKVRPKILDLIQAPNRPYVFYQIKNQNELKELLSELSDN